MSGDRPTPAGRDRGQVYTLQGLVGAIIVLTAVFFALQTIIITPTTGGSVDPAVREQLRTQADDILTVAAANESFGLSELARYWDQSSRTFEGAVNPRVGYGDRRPPNQFGRMLQDTFGSRSRLYNVELRYLGGPNATGPAAGPGTVPVVFRGSPSSNAVVATHTVTLYDNQTLTAEESITGGVELWQFDTNATDGDDGYYPVPNAVEGPVYNVLEVRLIVW